jgi:hypothetical protein
MQTEESFKERVKNVIINCAKIYKENFVEYEYVLCSDAFTSKDFYIIDAKEDNYQHLTGVNSLIGSQEFFDKSINQTLQESDFNFIKKGQPEKSVIGSVRRKINALPNIVNILKSDALVEENFTKNQIKCSFATTDNQCTIGFIDETKSRPMSLLKGNELDYTKARSINLLLRKHISKEKFDEIIIGNIETLNNYRLLLETFLDENIISQLNEVQESIIEQQLGESKLQAAPVTEE